MIINSSMHYTVYKTTNTINGMVYIGKHQTADINDDYIGSGHRLMNAISKYGRQNFEKEVLFVYDNESDMDRKERELVTEEFARRPDTYNLRIGGEGGWSHVRINEELNEKRLRNHRKKLEEMKNDPEYRVVAIQKTKETKLKNGTWGKGHADTGYKHSPETIEKMKQTHKGIGLGESNSQYGTKWITNGSENRKINKAETVPTDWYYGRTL